MIFVVNGANAVSSTVVRSLVTWNMAVPPDDTTLAYTSQCHALDMHALPPTRPCSCECAATRATEALTVVPGLNCRGILVNCFAEGN